MFSNPQSRTSARSGLAATRARPLGNLEPFLVSIGTAVTFQLVYNNVVPVLVTDSRVMAIVQRFVNETRDGLHAADSTLWLLDETEAFLTPLSSARTPAGLFADMRTPVDDSVIGVVARTGMPTVIGPEDHHNPIAERVSGIPTEWMVAAPVYVRGVLRGVVSAIQSDARKAFAGEDIDLLAWRAELLGYILQVGLDTTEAAV